MRPMANIALKSLRSGSDWLREYREQQDFSGVPADQVQIAVRKAEKNLLGMLTRSIKRYHPKHWVDFTDTSESPPQWAEGCWYLSRILGQRNFISGYPYYALALHIVIHGKTEHAVLIAPATQDEFSASRGHGARCNERRLRVSRCKQLEGAIMGCNDLGIAGKLLNPQATESVNSESGRPTIRSQGCDALDITYTAAARLDAAIVLDPVDTELEAALLLAGESGAMTSSFSAEGGSKKGILSANSRIRKLITDRLRDSSAAS